MENIKSFRQLVGGDLIYKVILVGNDSCKEVSEYVVTKPLRLIDGKFCLRCSAFMENFDLKLDNDDITDFIKVCNGADGSVILFGTNKWKLLVSVREMISEKINKMEKSLADSYERLDKVKRLINYSR